MREIKYRAYDKSTNCMMDVGEIHFLHGGIKVEGTGVSIGNGWVTEANGHEHDCDVILMESTGLKDKNGKDIYEDDVVDSQDGICKVIYVQCSFCLIDAVGRWLNLAGQYMHCEVLGNIYENPETLGE